MSVDAPFPSGSDDEKVLLVQWLDYLRGSVLRKAAGLSDEQGRWTPDGALLPIVGIVNHLARVEWRWIEGGFLGARVDRTEDEFRPTDLPMSAAAAAYAARAEATDEFIATHDLALRSEEAGWARGADLRYVVLHLINETARHAGHADATRELLDGTTGE